MENMSCAVSLEVSRSQISVFRFLCDVFFHSTSLLSPRQFSLFHFLSPSISHTPPPPGHPCPSLGPAPVHLCIRLYQDAQKNKKALFVTVCLYYVANKRSIIWSQWSQQLFCVAAVKWRSEKWRDAKNEKRMKSIETRWRVDRQIERFPSLFPVTADFPPWGGQTRVANEWESWKKSPRWRICINCNWIE